MNATIERIVELMFQDVEMNDEVQALHDEVMNNCQERFDDLMARGMAEDAAIGEVVESLKGMDEVIAQYPKKASKAAAAEEPDQAREGFFITDEQVRELRIVLGNDDMDIEPSADNTAQVLGDMDAIDVCMEDGTLSIKRRMSPERPRKGHMSFDFDKASVGMDSAEKFMRSIGSAIDNLSKRIKEGIDHLGGDRVTVRLPREWCADINIHTSSGDVDIRDVSARRVVCDSSSGDVHVSGVAGLETLRVNTASGDIEAEAAEDGARLEEAALKTMSGDVYFSGACRVGRFTSVSGDINVEGVQEEAQMKSTSGDIKLHQWETGLRRATLQSVSGDITVRLPENTMGVVATTHSVSGDCRCDSFLPAQQGERLEVSAHTVSGDIRIQRR